MSLKSNTLQICLMLDCTESMTEWIDMSKKKLLDILDSVKQDNPTYDIEVAYISYRDIEDGNDRIHVYNFTKNHPFIVEKINESVAKGGGDEAEDVAIAYHKANRLNWNADVRIVVHIADAPAHGFEFHTTDVSDQYPNGTLGISLKREITNVCLKNIKIIFGEINGTTIMMTNKFEEIYSDLNSEESFSIIQLNQNWSDLTDKAEKEDYFYNALSDSISQEVSKHSQCY